MDIIRNETSSGFQKILKGREVLALAFGAMIGWSWVLVTDYWLISAGTLGTVIAFSIGGIAVTLIGLTYGELASAMPRAGGEHIYTSRALGDRWSFVCTWALLFSYINVCAFEAVALPKAIAYLVPDLKLGTLWSVRNADVDISYALIGVTATVIVSAVNYVGIKTAAILQTIVTAMILACGLVLIFGASVQGELTNAAPLLATPTNGILMVLIMVPAMLVGFDVIPQSAEEIDVDPKKLGVLLSLSIGLAVLWYILISISVGVALTNDQLESSEMATADAASQLWASLYGGSWAGSLLVIGGIGGILTSWNAFIIGGSRVIFALAESGKLPKYLGKIHPKYKTPHVAITVIGVMSSLAPFFGETILVWLINSGSFAVTVAFLFVAISFLVLRKKEPEMHRPFKVKHGNLVGSGAVLMSLMLLSGFLPWSPSALVWPAEWATLFIWSSLGVIFLVYYENKKANRVGGEANK